MGERLGGKPMSSNRTIRRLMEKKYGKICMMEAAGIRCIPVEERKRLNGYKSNQEALTYHHLRPRSKRRTSNRREWSNT